MNSKSTIVLSGGGVYGIAHIGVLQYIYEKFTFDNITVFCGTSIGAFISSMILIGWVPKDLIEFIYELNFTHLKQISLNTMLEKMGLDDGSRIEYILKRLIEQKGFSSNITLKQLYNKTKKNLIITTVCVNDKSTYYISHETDPELKLFTAIRMSISLPIFFTPVVYKNKLYIDGGTMDSYPIHIFKDNINEVIGVYLSESINSTLVINNIEDYILGTIGCIKKSKEFFSQKGYEKNTIKCIMDEYNFMNFSLSLSDKKKYYNIGYESAKKYFNDLVKDNKNNEIIK